MIHDHPFKIGFCADKAHLRILATTDLHLNLMPWDYYGDRPAPGVGLARTAGLIRILRGAVDNCLLLDNGDYLQGTPLSDLASDQTGDDGAAHPAIAAMNALGYDGATLGNHEFNFGIGFLQRALAGARFPVVSANVTLTQGDDPSGDSHLVPAHAILDREIVAADGSRQPIRIGIIGFAPPQIVDWDRLQLCDRIGTRDIVEAARAHVPRLLAAGADIVIALCHSGIGAADHLPGMENASVPLAAVPGIDAVLAGHTHQVFPGPGVAPSAEVDPGAGTLHGKPAVMAGHGGSHLGVIDLLLHRQDGRWRPIAHATRTEPVAQRGADDRVTPLVDCDAAVVASARQAHDRLLRRIRRPIGATTTPLHSYFASVGPDAPRRVVAAAVLAHGRRMLAGSPEAGLPLLAAIAPFRAGGRSGPDNFIDIPAGPLLLRHAAELYVYPNTVVALALTGADIADWLERSAAAFRQIVPGQTDQPLLDPACPSYNFDVIEGLDYAIDPSAPPRTDATGRTVNPGARRIVDLRLGGRPLDPDQPLILLTNSYRVGGGGGFAAARGGRIVCHCKTPTRDIVVGHIRAAGPLTPDPTPGWRFRPLPGTAAWFDSGPLAMAHLGATPGRDIRPAGPGHDGFRRFALHF